MGMILKFIVACHVSTIPKSPPKMIREEKKIAPDEKKNPVFFIIIIRLFCLSHFLIKTSLLI